MFVEPQPTRYDLCFPLFGFPVRVHPMFWLIAILLGGIGQDADIVPRMAIWVVVVFFSILIHELGHAVVMRRFGERARICLYWMGGLAISDGTWRSSRGRNTFEQVLISFAGPAAGFILAGLLLLILYATGTVIGWQPQKYSENIRYLVPLVQLENQYLTMLVNGLLYFNAFWGAVNLIPVYPLDGGQICRAAYTHLDPQRGVEQSLWISVVSGGLTAVAGLLLFRSFFIAMFFGFMAYNSYQMIANIRTGGFGGGGSRRW